MFEEEAEEYKDNTRIKDKNTYISFPDECISEVQDFEGNYIDISERIIKTFKDGAEFGYNKANEWHYVKDGDLPKDEKDMLMSCSLILLIKMKCSDCLSLALGQFNFSTQEFSYQHIIGLTDVIAWKEIVLPKESE
jgi:hypothetical protein